MWATIPLVCQTPSLAGILSVEAVPVSTPTGVNECLARARHLIVEPSQLVRLTRSSHGGQVAEGRPTVCMGQNHTYCIRNCESEKAERQGGERETHTDTDTDTDTDTQAGIQTDLRTDRHTYAHTYMSTDRHTKRQIYSERERERERERESVCACERDSKGETDERDRKLER